MLSLLRCPFAALLVVSSFLASEAYSSPFFADGPGQVVLSSPQHDVPFASASNASDPPHWVIYSDKYVSGDTGPPNVTSVEGFNVFILSFLLTEGAYDKAEEWTTLTKDQRTQIKKQYADAGIKLMVSAFGSTDTPTSSGADAIKTADNFAEWVQEYDLDGIDVDYEDLAAMDARDGKAEQWLANFTTELRVKLPAGSYIITHAPVAPWFSPDAYNGKAYLEVDKSVGSLIDWYNVQFYNQGSTEYTDCDGLLTRSSTQWANTSVFEIANTGVPLNKLVIGKPAQVGDASNGYMDADTLAGCLSQAKAKNWTAGAMVWEYPNAATSWIKTVRSKSWPA
ncbi:glycoside hydrolase [Punctularia strigosozonata HHB-11173 SS5]|uniref:glycoside hydrolase n=1 Tax=Punctularia strigosozonata (strain HHB-11173) TaxID=741275 RepID=UPI0004416919|nr:glycoside hydrolase [Punctularia strigosozonata HHB-11173 SS5]EIN05993.1 glycoside hydrolase [Punctularia strigosozonata HHB-11173 SS5]